MVTVLFSGLTTGALYCLVAIGYNVVLLASGVFNFAYAYLIMLSTYMVYVAASVLGLPLIGVIAFSGAAMTVFAVAEYRIAIAPLFARKGDHHQAMLITTVGIATILDGVVPQVWGSVAKPEPTPISGPSLHLFGGTVGRNDLLIIGLVLVVGVGLHFWSRRTIGGLAALATAEDAEAAQARGVNTKRLALVAFAVSGAIAGLFGVLVGVETYATPTLGDTLSLLGFVAIVIGGFGSQIGGLIGGFVIGLLYAFAERYLNTQWPPIMVFFGFVFILLIRPRGIFSVAAERQV